MTCGRLLGASSEDCGSGGLVELAQRSPVPWQQFVDAIDRMIGDAGEDVGEIGFGVEAVHLGASR